MSSPEIPPESTPPPEQEASPPLLLPPTSLPLPPIAVIASSPLLSPPAPPLSPSPATPASSPSLPALPSFPPKSPPQPPLLSPPKPPAPSTPPPAPALSIPPPAPALSSSPPAPALSTHLPSHPPPPELPSNPPASPVKPTKPEPPSSSTIPSTATPKAPAPIPPARFRHRHSSARSPSSSSSSSSTSSRSTTPPGSKPLPTTISSAPPPVASPTSQPFTGGSSPDDMPLTAEKPAPQPSVPLTVGGGSRPAMAVLPAGANGGSNIQAATAGRGGGTPTAGVSTGIIAGLCVGGVVLVALLVFGILLVFCKRRKGDRFDDCGAFACDSKSDSQGKLSLPTYTKGNTSFPDMIIGGSVGSANSASGMALVSIPLAVPSTGTFTYEELVSATNGFSESNLLGQGGFGYVHKGVLPNGKEVAVKQLKMGGQQGEREFRAEVETISQVHHKHLVSLVGYCIAGAERLLVYEFVPNQTMDFHLHGKDQPVMEWSTRLRIAIGSAKGLAYLHEDCNPTIIHRDIKAANILLDFNCEVKVSDFGLAKIFSNTNASITHITTRVVGTFGYLAPEYASSGKVTDKSDVYSYGVMLLELITGRPPITTSESAMNGSLVNWARPLLPKAIEEGNFDTLVDPRLQNSYNVDEMANMVACAAACVRLSAWRRPRMSQVIRALEGDLSPSDLDDGVRPGHSSMQFPYESFDFDAQKYMEDMRKLRMALSSNSNEGARYSDNTSEYGLQPSISSADSHELNTRSLRLGRD